MHKYTYIYIHIYICINRVSEQLNCNVPHIKLKIYGIRQALLFSCCKGFKNSNYVFTKCVEGFQRSIE